jgi:hypothetical protein
MEKGSSVWIAQRNGRTKNGDDRTDQGLMKMFSLSGTGDFEADFNELHIVPVAISYEYEPCDVTKALASYAAMTGLYEKTPHEDMISMLLGISQQKGDCHLQVCKPITEEEVAYCASFDKNERFSAMAHIVDERIYDGYKLHKTNYIAADLASGEPHYDDMYTTSQMEDFIDYLSHADSPGPSIAARETVLDILLQIYSKPVFNKIRQ